MTARDQRALFNTTANECIPIRARWMKKHHIANTQYLVTIPTQLIRFAILLHTQHFSTILFSMNTQRPHAASLIISAALAFTLIGCQGSSDAPPQTPATPSTSTTTSTPASKPTSTPTQPDQPPTTITLDGLFTDWQDTNTGFADERFIYITFSPESEFPHSIQAAPITTRIRLDIDQSPQTGRPMQWMSIDASIQQPQGVDLLFELSPKNELGSIGIGSSVTSYDSNGDAHSLGHANLGFMFLPTFGSSQYELRIDRLAPGADMLHKAGKISVVIDQVTQEDRFLWSTTLHLDLPPIGKSNRNEATLPAKPAKSARIMSSNVLFSSPLNNPDAFKRVLSAINPDVILYQEWFNTPVADVQSWLNTHAGTGWKVHMPSSKAGVAIATKRPIIKTYESVIPPSGTGRPARAVAALIDTDAGELLAISIHLKCCGSADSQEDNKRIKQAQSINGFVRSVHKKHPNAKVVIAGDFNLVGSYRPMDAMTNSLGINGEDLSTINAQQLGDASMITWNDEKSRFSPGRLDWMLIDESMSKAANAFILDTRALSPASLDAMGLQAEDSKASDHLPIVIDLIDAD